MTKEKTAEQTAAPVESKKAVEALKFPFDVCLGMYPRFRASLAVILDKEKSYTKREVEKLLTDFRKREVK